MQTDEFRQMSIIVVTALIYNVLAWKLCSAQLFLPVVQEKVMWEDGLEAILNEFEKGKHFTVEIAETASKDSMNSLPSITLEPLIKKLKNDLVDMALWTMSGNPDEQKSLLLKVSSNVCRLFQKNYLETATFECRQLNPWDKRMMKVPGIRNIVKLYREKQNKQENSEKLLH